MQLLRKKTLQTEGAFIPHNPVAPAPVDRKTNDLERLQALADAVLDCMITFEDFLKALRTDAALIQMLFEQNSVGLAEHAHAFLRDRRHQKAANSRTSVSAHLRTLGGIHPSPRTLEAAATVAKQSAKTVLLLIDNRDIREWTIGQCRSAGRRKSREARLLERLGAELGHLKHTDTIGSVLSDKQIKAYISDTA